MEKRCSLGLFPFAILLAFDSAFAAQIEAIAKNGKPPIRKSSDARPLVMNSAAFPARQSSASFRSPTAVSVEDEDRDNCLFDR
jgi:hypothetical protein